MLFLRPKVSPPLPTCKPIPTFRLSNMTNIFVYLLIIPSILTMPFFASSLPSRRTSSKRSSASRDLNRRADIRRPTGSSPFSTFSTDWGGGVLSVSSLVSLAYYDNVIPGYSVNLSLIGILENCDGQSCPSLAQVTRWSCKRQCSRSDYRDWAGREYMRERVVPSWDRHHNLSRRKREIRWYVRSLSIIYIRCLSPGMQLGFGGIPAFP